jgi:tetratricopeptide (TPR) repeat protein
VASIPLVVSSRDFQAVKLQWEAKRAETRGDVQSAKAAAANIASLSQEPGQHPFAKLIITLQAKEAEAFAAQASRDSNSALTNLKEAVAIEDSIDDLSQPPYPAIPAAELCGYLLLELKQPSEAASYFQKTLKRTPNRPKAILGLARAARASGDTETAATHYKEFLSVWKNADSDRPELAEASQFLQGPN